MTTAIIGGVEAEVRELASREDLLRQALDALAAYDRAVRGLIAHDLTDQGPVLRESRDKARARLTAAEDALAGPEQAVKALEDELADCDREMADLSACADGDDRRARVRARAMLAEYERERSDLVKKLDFALGQVSELRVPRDLARTSCEVIEAAFEGLLWAIAADQYGPAGQQTGAYQVWRLRAGRLAPVLWDFRTDHDEWPAAVEFLRELCVRSGHEPPQASRGAISAARAMASAADSPAPVPSGAEVMAQVHAEMANLALQKTKTHVDDLRYPAAPRPVPERPYMEVPRLKDMLR